MSPSTKAVLLSALICPGAGHMYLKQPARATALFITIFVALWIIVSNALDHATTILNQIQSQGLAIDINNIAEISAEAAQNSDDMSSNFALIALLICWIFAIVDAYRLGKIKEASSTE